MLIREHIPKLALAACSSTSRTTKALSAAFTPSAARVERSIYVPAGPKLFGTMDTVVGHYRRYTREELEEKMVRACFVIDKLFYQNSFGRFGWWWNGRVLRSSHMPGFQSKVFDRIVPLLRKIESTPPSRGLSLVALAHRPGERKRRSAEEAHAHVPA